MSDNVGRKVSLQLVKPQRYKVEYEISLDDEVIGEIELDHIAWRSGEAELRISINEEQFHNHGYGTQAVTALLQQAFLKMNLRRVYLRVQANNPIAIRCYEKAGFRKEGRLSRETEWGIEEEIFLMGVTAPRFFEKQLN